MKGYKVFNPDWTCRGFQFEVGKIFTEDVEPVCCDKGFHFCRKVADCFSYYSFDPNNKVAEVEALGNIDINEDGTKCSTNKIHIIRELTWQEVLDMVNTGKDCTGLHNSGNRNSGDRNSGGSNSGDRNSGDFNSGSWNSGDCNSGNGNSGSCNSGDCNSGNHNTGDCNSGSRNTGSYNSGDWNKTNFSNGCFNTELSKIFMFNKPSDWTYQDWFTSKARFILCGCPSDSLSWIQGFRMTDKEKSTHPEYSTTGGFLRYTEEKDKKQTWWNALSEESKNVVMSIPNFDKDIFKEMTGIDVEAYN